MTKSQQDFIMWEGEYKEIPISVIDGAGAAIDLTGATITWVLSQRGANGVTFVTKTIGSGITVVSAAGGTLLVVLNAADTVNMGGDIYYHELAITDGAGHPEIGLIGQVHLNVSRLL